MLVGGAGGQVGFAVTHARLEQRPEALRDHLDGEVTFAGGFGDDAARRSGHNRPDAQPDALNNLLLVVEGFIDELDEAVHGDGGAVDAFDLVADGGIGE